MSRSTGLASLLGAYNSDSEVEEDEEFVPQTSHWGICEDKVTKSPYYWNLETKEVTWTMPDDLLTYLSYVDTHKDALLKWYGDGRWISHSGQANGSTFYLDEMYRKVSWEIPPTSTNGGMPRNSQAVVDREKGAAAETGQVRGMHKGACWRRMRDEWLVRINYPLKGKLQRPQQWKTQRSGSFFSLSQKLLCTRCMPMMAKFSI